MGFWGFGEAATSKCVAQVLLGDDSRVEDDQAVFASPFHCKNINLNDFKEFITTKMTDQIKNGTHVMQTVGSQNLQLIANGLDIWAQPGVKPSEREPNAQSLIDIFFMNFAFLKSSIHDIEAAVKEANFIAKANRSEVANSHRVAVRSFILPYANQVAKKAMKEDYAKKGKAHDESKHKMKIRGTRKIWAVLDKVKEINQDIGGARKEDEIWKTMNETNTKSSELFRKKRVEKKVETFKAKKNNTRARNKIQNESGVSLSPLVIGLIPLGKLTKDKHFDLLIEEAKARGINSINHKALDKAGINKVKGAI